VTASAASVSAFLRRAGFNPSGSAARNREGLRVTSSLGSAARVAADLDSLGEALHLIADVRDALVDAGYRVAPMLDADQTFVYVMAEPG
jgi:hypothetical protein